MMEYGTTDRMAYRAPVIEELTVRCETGMAQSLGSEGAAGGDLVTDDTDLGW